MALEGRPRWRYRQGRLTMAAPSAVFTIARTAEILHETVELLDEIADQLEPEDGCLWIYDTDERATMRGIESIEELIADQRRRPANQHRYPRTRRLSRMNTDHRADISLWGAASSTTQGMCGIS